MGNASIGASGPNHLCVQIDSDIVKLLCPQRLISGSHVHLTCKNLLDSIAERAHKVLSQQTEVRVKVDVGVCVALGGEVGSKKGPLLLTELLRCGVDRYVPEILLIFCARVREMQQLWKSFESGVLYRIKNQTKRKYYLVQNLCCVRERNCLCLISEFPPWISLEGGS